MSEIAFDKQHRRAQELRNPTTTDMVGSLPHTIDVLCMSSMVQFGSLLINRLSDNVGSVKQFSSTLRHALEQERHFALVEKTPCPTKARS
jgi:hypothetical protein